MAPEVLYRVCHGTATPTCHQRSSIVIKPAILHSYRRHRIVFVDYPAIVPSSPSSDSHSNTPRVRGTLVTGLTDADMWRLDIFEGDEYERRVVKVRILLSANDVGGGDGGEEYDRTAKKDDVVEREGEEVEAETYVFIGDPNDLEEDEWDFDEFVTQKIDRWIGLGGEDEYTGKDVSRCEECLRFVLVLD